MGCAYMENEDVRQLLSLHRRLYTIELNRGEDNYYVCYYRIMGDAEHILREASSKKILQRLVYTFGLNKEEAEEIEVMEIQNDLEAITKVLRISEEFLSQLMNRYW